SPSGNTLTNFLPGQETRGFFDDHIKKHGTAVTAIALRALETANAYPRIMILKALDSNKTGSVFSVSCALSYAAQNNVTVINASLGYYSQGPVDPILQKYVLLCTNRQPNPAFVFAAAGNTRGDRNQGNFCLVPPASNELGHPDFFY